MTIILSATTGLACATLGFALPLATAASLATRIRSGETDEEFAKLGAAGTRLFVRAAVASFFAVAWLAGVGAFAVLS